MFAVDRRASNGDTVDGPSIAVHTPEHDVPDPLQASDSVSSLNGGGPKGTNGYRILHGLGLYGDDVATGRLLDQNGALGGTSESSRLHRDEPPATHWQLAADPVDHRQLEVQMEHQSQLPTPSHDSEASHIGFNGFDDNSVRSNNDIGEPSKAEKGVIPPLQHHTAPHRNDASAPQTPQATSKGSQGSSYSDLHGQATPEKTWAGAKGSLGIRGPGGSRSTGVEFRARSSLPSTLAPAELARQCFLAAYSSRLNPTALHPGEYKLLRDHITLPQVSIYLNIRNAILRLWTRNPLVSVREDEAAGCARDSRYFSLALLAREWLMRHGYINFGCVDLPNTAKPVPRSKSKAGKVGKRATIAVIGAGMSGLGCARHLEGLIAQLGHRWTDRGERPPKVIVLEGRHRLGGRIHSHELRTQHKGTLPPGLRSTAEMGAQIVTGFEHGNPMNIIIRGQLGIHTYALKDNSILYDHDGSIVGKERDSKVENLYNDVLERASVFRNLAQPPRTVHVDRQMLSLGKEPADDGGPTISQLEQDGLLQTEPALQDQTKGQVTKQAAISTEKLTGRAYQIAGQTSRVPAAEAAVDMGWSLLDGTPPQATIDLTPPSDPSNPGTLGDTMDEGISQYQKLLPLTAEDLRLLNWHHANLEYANSANVSQLSLTGWDQDLGNEFEGEHTEIVGGYSQVPRGIWQCPYPLDVRLGMKAIEVTQHESVPWSSITTAMGDVVNAEHIVVTTSLGVLKSGAVEFFPPLPDWKAGAIDRLGFGLLNKVVLVYERAFWEESRDMFGLLNDSSPPGSLDPKHYSSRRGRFYLFWNIIKTSGRPTLVALMAGDAAYQAEKEDDQGLIHEVTSRLAQMFPAQEVPLPLEAIVTRWKRDPFTCGSYSYVGPKTRSGDYEVMAQPWGPIHFAGEATCGTHPATVHGAYLSGLRAAAEVIDDLLGPVIAPDELIPAKSKLADGTPGSASAKRKWSESHPQQQLSPTAAALKTQSEAYEASIINAIFSELGERPFKPAKQGVNPFLLYQKDSWYKCKADMDAEVQRKSGKPGAKASKTDVRIALGNRWRNAPEAERKPYLDAAQASKDGVAALTAEYVGKVKRWDEEAMRIREEYIAAHPLPGGAEKLFSRRTAVELGRTRKNRKVDGYDETSPEGKI